MNTDRLAEGLGWFSIGLGAMEIFAPRQLERLVGLKDNDRRRTILRTYGFREVAAGVAILAQRGEKRTPWLWGRVAGDVLDLSTLGAAFVSRGANRARMTAATAAVAGVTALDVICSQQLTNGTTHDRRTRARKTIIIDRQPGDIYNYWRDFSNQARFMDFVQSVEKIGERRSRWRMKVPGLRTMEWDNEITNDVPESLIAWRSSDESEIEMSGTVRFEPAPGGRGTLVSLTIQFVPPGGALGAAIAKMLQKIPKYELEMCLRKLKQVMETGEIARSDASIHTGTHAAQPPAEVPEPVFSH